MKRIILIICIATLSNSLFSQSAIGVKLGANYANLKFSKKSYTTSSVFGEQFGIFYTHTLKEKITLQGEVGFSGEGNNWKENNTTGSIEELQIRVPVLVQYNLTGGLYAEAGPQYSLLLSIKQSTNDGEYESIKEFYKPGTLGYALGVGYRFRKTLSGFMTGLRYNGDFSKINKSAVGGQNLKNSVIQFSIMYAFQIKKGKQ